MAWLFGKKNESNLTNVNADYKPSMYFGENIIQRLKEQFKGEIESKKIKFPADLGEEHPFDFEILEKLYKKFGFFTAVVDKYVDFIVGPGFYIKCKEARAKEIIDNFMQDVNFDTLLRRWIKEALIKGNGFLEIGGNKKDGIEGMKLLNANYMYVVRDNKGVIEGYNQYKGGFDRFAKTKVIPLSVENIAHIPFNDVGDCAYGLGIGYPAMMLIDNWLMQNKSMHKLMDRKANAPIHAKFGYINGDTKIIPKSEDIAAFGKDLETMSNKTEWTTDPLVEFKVVDFGNFGDKFEKVLDNDLNMLIYAFQIPGVLLGMSNVPEGLARVQMEGFQRRIQSIQAETEKVVENKIFQRILVANGFDVHVEFEWGTPSIMETEGRMQLISEMMKSPTVSGAMNIMLEEEMINLLKFDKSEWEKLKLEQQGKEDEEMKRILGQPTPQVPGQNAKFPQKLQPKAEQPKQPKPEEMMKPFIDMILSQEEKRNALFISSQQEQKQELANKRKEELDLFKEIIDKIKEEKEDDINKKLEELKNQKIEQKIKQINPIRKKIEQKRLGLLSAFRITRKTEKLDEPIEEKYIEEFVKKVGDEYCVFSHQTGKKFGCYPTKAQAEKRLAQIHKFAEKVEIKNYEYEKECAHCSESWDNYNEIEEWLGFNYKKYLAEILTQTEAYDFGYIRGVTEAELAAGYLTETQVGKLKKILNNGFTKGKSIQEMAKQADKSLELKDLYRMTGEGTIKTGTSGLPILARSAEKRGIGIVRSEVTRLSNSGAVEYYKKNDIKQVRWVASYGDRTCQICEGLDGQIFEINNHPEIPQHPLCRCMLNSVAELK